MTLDLAIFHVNLAVNHKELDIVPQIILAMPFGLALILYVSAAFLSRRNFKPWPKYRSILWVLGVFFAVISIFGPLAELAHVNFPAHMIGHLFLGMLAPLLMAAAAPLTLLLRTLSVRKARRVSRLLKSLPFRMYSNPIVASYLNIGGLWILYTTSLYSLIHEHVLLHVLVHFHIFIAGYLFTISMVYIDRVSHRLPFLFRAIVFVAALAGHGILSKIIYAHPPEGIPVKEAEIGGMLMYYGGDAVDIVLIIILCWQWYKAARPRTVLTKANRKFIGS